MLLLLTACADGVVVAEGIRVGSDGATLTAADGRELRLVVEQGAPMLAGDPRRVEAVGPAGRWSWEARPEGVELGIVVDVPTDALVLSVRVEGARPVATHGSVWLEGEGDPWRVSGIKAWDADGRRLSARLGAEGDSFVMYVATRGARFPVTVDPLVSPDSAGAAAGGFLVPVGDLDADGYEDLALGDDDYLGKGRVLAMAGGPDGPELGGTWSVSGYGSQFPRGLAGGDFDADGAADLGILSFTGHDPGIQVDVYPGSAAGLGAAPVATLNDGTEHDDGVDFMTTADFDLDGFADLVRVRADGTAVDVYFGSSTGLATTAGLSISPDVPVYRVLVHDLDGDGLQDVVIGARNAELSEYQEGVVEVYLGSSGYTGAADWSFSSGRRYGTCGAALAAGDVDGDGLVELVVGCPLWTTTDTYSGRVAVFEGEALGTTYSWAVDGVSSNDELGTVIALGDVDGDGRDELVIGGAEVLTLCAGDLCAERQDVDGGDFLVGMADAIAIVDADGDGYADLGVVEGEGSYGSGWYGELWWWRGGPGGITLQSDPPDARITVADSLAGSVLADPDADGTSTIYSAELDVALYAVDEAVSTAVSPSRTSEFGFELGAGDLNGDGYPDVVVGSALPVYVYDGGAAGLSSTESGSASPCYDGWGNVPLVRVVGDVNGDGYDDVIGTDRYWSLYTGCATVLFGGAGTFGTDTQTIEGDLEAAQFGESVVGTGDLDGDGYDDVLIGSPSDSRSLGTGGRVELRRGGASGLAASPDWVLDPETESDGPDYLSVADLDADGLTDLVLVATGWGEVRWYRGSGTSFETSPAWRGAGNGAWLLPDLDGDGDAELAVWGNEEVETLVVYAGTPDGPGGPLHTFSEDDSPTICLRDPEAGDLDGDGVAELVLTCASGYVEVWSGGPSASDLDGDGWTADVDCDDLDPREGLDGCAEPVDTGGVDSGVDTSVDSGADSGVDSGVDSAVDSAVDSGADSGVDTSVESGADSGVDSGVDSGADTDMATPPVPASGCGGAGGGCGTSGAPTLLGVVFAALLGRRSRARGAQRYQRTSEAGSHPSR